MERFLIFLLFISFSSSEFCKGGIKAVNNKCICPKGTILKQNECVNDNSQTKIESSNCPKGQIRLANGTCINNPLTVLVNPFPIHVVKKPVIYLYPEESMDISVQLNVKDSKFTTIYPKFTEKNTWNVHANPNGDIFIKDRVYPYLFWEAESYISQDTNEGFIVNNENAEKFLEEKLDILGLNEKEKTDFITFWLPVLLRNKLSLCSFQTQKFFDNYELNITPKPDSLIRVFLTIKKLDKPINIREQKLESVERKGFTVVEWGGSDI